MTPGAGRVWARVSAGFSRKPLEKLVLPCWHLFSKLVARRRSGIAPPRRRRVPQRKPRRCRCRVARRALGNVALVLAWGSWFRKHRKTVFLRNSSLRAVRKRILLNEHLNMAGFIVSATKSPGRFCKTGFSGFAIGLSWQAVDLCKNFRRIRRFARTNPSPVTFSSFARSRTNRPTFRTRADGGCHSRLDGVFSSGG